MPCWWKDTVKGDYKMNGGFQKYYPKDVRYVFDEFMSKPKYWMNYYIENETTIGPVNGEQYFVEDMVKKKLNLKFLPESWVCRWKLNCDKAYSIKLNHDYPHEWLHLGGEFHPDIKLIHYLNQKPFDKKQLEALVNSQHF